MRTRTPPSILDNIAIAKPCCASWDNMEGDERVRDCSQCKLSVYNISEMSKEDAERLILENEGRLCIRLYRRPDGTLITDECPVALRKFRNSLRNFTRIAAAALTCLISFSVGRASADNEKSCGAPKIVTGKENESVDRNSQILQGSPAPIKREMGKIRVIKKDPTAKLNSNVPKVNGSSRVLMGEAEALPKQAGPVQVFQGNAFVKPQPSSTLPEIKTKEYNSAVKSISPTKKSGQTN